MNFRPISVTVAALLIAGTSARADPPIIADRPVLWSVHFDAERLRTGVGRELFTSLDPVLTALSGENAAVPGGKLESIAISGFQPHKAAGPDFPFVAEINFSADGGGIANRFEAISKKHGAPIETLAGRPAMHFQHEGQEAWIVKCSDSRVLLSVSRGLLEKVLVSDTTATSSSPPSRPDEILGGNIEIKRLLAENTALAGSELLKLLPHLEFHLFSKGDQIDLDASAELDSERSARRAARMIDGMVAAISMQDAGGVPWDERLVLKQDGPGLALQLHLEPREARRLLESFAREIQVQVKAAEHQE